MQLRAQTESAPFSIAVKQPYFWVSAHCLTLPVSSSSLVQTCTGQHMHSWEVMLEGRRVTGRETSETHIRATDTNTGPQLSPVSCSCWSHWSCCHHQPVWWKSLKWQTANNTKTDILVLLFQIWCSIFCVVWCDTPVRVPVITSQLRSSCVWTDLHSGHLENQ